MTIGPADEDTLIQFTGTDGSLQTGTALDASYCLFALEADNAEAERLGMVCCHEET